MRRVAIICVAALALLQSSASAQQPGPVRILVTYYSETGNTEKLAQAIGAGAKTVQGVEVTLSWAVSLRSRSRRSGGEHGIRRFDAPSRATVLPDTARNAG